MIIKLNKKSSTDKNLIWEASVKDNNITYRYGQEDGKIQIKVDVIKAGKNTGKKNATTPAEQAVLVAETKALKKLDDGYKLVSGKLPKHETHQMVDVDCPKPMLAQTYNDHKNKVSDGDVIYAQAKLDGFRIIANTKTGKLYSRKRKLITSYPHIEEEVRKINIPGVTWIDGELYNPDVSFEDIISTRRTKTTNDNMELMQFHIFDVVSNKPFSERHEIVNSIKENDIIKRTMTDTIKKNQIDSIHSLYVSMGYEGVMLRVTNKGYEEKRSYSLYKYKNFFDKEFEITGFKSLKNDETKLGSIEFKTEESETFYANPKFSHVRRAEIFANKEEYLGKMATVKYQEMTEKNVPRFGRVIEIRDYE